MKKLINDTVLVLTILLAAFSFKVNACSTQTVAGLDSCTVKDLVGEILSAIRPNEEYMFEPRQSIDDNRNLYERLSMNNKPTLAEMRAALDAWKDARRPRIQFREDLKALKYGSMGAVRCGFARPNNALLRRDILKNMDQAKLDCLKQKDAEIQAEVDEIVSKQNQVKMIKQALKDWDCSTISEEYTKQLCLMNKMRF